LAILNSPEFYLSYGHVLWLFHIFAFIFGACFGSFINVCTWRIPRGESLYKRGSHCPHCDHAIRLHENVPIFGWLSLGGRCSSCRNPISPRYIIMELVVGALFTLLWVRACSIWPPMPVSALLPLWFIGGALVTITVIDFEHFIIPDLVTVPGLIVALTLCLLLPNTHFFTYGGDPLLHAMRQHPMAAMFAKVLSGGRESGLWYAPQFLALIDAFLGIILGGGVLWLLGEIGYLVFGRHRIRHQQPVTLELSREGLREEPDSSHPLVEPVGFHATIAKYLAWLCPRPVEDGEVEPWEDMIEREGDTIVIHGRITALRLTGKNKAPPWEPEEDVVITITETQLFIGETEVPRDKLKEFRVRSPYMERPREAMGLGDVKLMAMLGAFLGPEAAFFILGLSAVLGSAFGILAGILSSIAYGRWNNVIPFGPAIAAAALVYLFRGMEILTPLLVPVYR
jgi:leader peptidase (prepilin peptidase)/N-methyltransferase